MSGEPQQPRTALLVEDNFLAALEVADTLTDLGFSVLGPFATSDDALRAMESAPRIEIAILDVHLRGGTCAPLIPLLRARETPFVLITGYSQPDLNDVLAGMPLPPRLGKPFSTRELRAVLAELAPPTGSRG